MVYSPGAMDYDKVQPTLSLPLEELGLFMRCSVLPEEQLEISLHQSMEKGIGRLEA